MGTADTMTGHPVIAGSIRRPTTRSPGKLRQAIRRAWLRGDLERLGTTRWAPPPPGLSWRAAFLIWLLDSIAFLAALRAIGPFGG